MEKKNMNKLEKYRVAWKNVDCESIAKIISKTIKKIRRIHKKELDKKGIPKETIQKTCICPVCESPDQFKYWISNCNGHIGFGCNNPECGFAAQQ
jgi:hypothetical protein